MSTFWCALGRIVMDMNFLERVEKSVSWDHKNEAAGNPQALFNLLIEEDLILSRHDLGELNRVCSKSAVSLRNMAKKAREYMMGWEHGPWEDIQAYSFLGCCMTDSVMRERLSNGGASDETFKPFIVKGRDQAELIHLVINLQEDIVKFEEAAWDPPCRTGFTDDDTYLHRSPRKRDRPKWADKETDWGQRVRSGEIVPGSR